jgi:hypothetical protein
MIPKFISRLLRTNDLFYKLFIVLCIAILTIITTSGYSEYKAGHQIHTAVDYAQVYYAAVIEHRDRTEKTVTTLEFYQDKLETPMPPSINGIELANDLHSLVIQLKGETSINGARLILTDTDDNPYRLQGCISPDEIEEKILPKRCRKDTKGN